jgi:branched-chain amino acid transport system substrate-binding protein
MGITRSNNKERIDQRTDTNYRVRTVFHGRIVLGGVVCMLLAVLLLASCSDVRPIVKIGLIAPFEGLHRRTGYEALAAMRQAIADAPASAIGFIPLALDDSADPERTRRAAKKLLVDPQVKAVVGPLSPALATASGDVLSHGGVAWFAPFAVAPAGGFAAPLDSGAWASGLAAAVGAAVQQQGATALVLAGDQRGWPAWNEAEWSVIAGVPTRFLESDSFAMESLTANDAIFWLGSAETAAAFLNAHPALPVHIPFWLSMEGGDPILSERLKIDSKLYWLAWSSMSYTEWAAHHEPSTPSAFLVYQATRAAIDAITGAAPTVAAPWRVELFELEAGVSRPYTP